MASSVPPVNGSAFTTYVSVISQADTDIFQTSVTLASGDVTVSKDGGSFTNIASLPVEIGSSGVLSVALTGTEMTADTVTVLFNDAAGDEWTDLLLVIHTAAQTLDTIDTNVDAILADTGTTGVALASGAVDDILERGVSNVEDTADAHSLATLILAALESSISGTVWTIKKTDGSTTFTTKTVSVDANADPVIGVT